MTREEAIRELREDKALYETDNCHAGDGSPDGDLLEAIDMAIEALSAEAVQGCDGCRYNTRTPQEQCLRCKRYWKDSYERKVGDTE